MFSVKKFGKELESWKYSWDEKNKIFRIDDSNLFDSCDLTLDFSGYNGVKFYTGFHCNFKTGDSCTFNTNDNCTFKTGSNCYFYTSEECNFDTGSHCTFETAYGCYFKTGSDCTFKTGENCYFKTGYNCIFNTEENCAFDTDSNCNFITGYSCKFETGKNCVITRKDVKGCIDIPFNEPIILNGYKISGYEKLKDLSGQVRMIEGREYMLQLVRKNKD